MKWMLLMLGSFAYQGAHSAPCHQQLLKLDYATFFCEQPFSSTGEIKTKRHQPALNEKFTCMHLVPLKKLAAFYTCYHQKCVSQNGRVNRGIRCCQHDSQFQQMQQDLHNLVPETKQLKQQRERYTFAEISDSDSTPKKMECHFVINKKTKQLEPAPSKRGIIARAYLYMKDTYPFRLSDEEMALYLKWHQQYPVTTDERKRNQMIFEMQGKRNHWVR